MNTTSIEWADKSWNPWSGCVPISAGCKNCYAKTQAERFAGGVAFPNGFGLTVRDSDSFLAPLRLSKPSRIFVNSMTDAFWDQVPDALIDRMFATILANHVLGGWGRRPHMVEHQFLILTKRAERMAEYFAIGRDTLLSRWAKAGDTSFNIDDGHTTFSEYLAGRWEFIPWPLPQLWLGVSVENKKTAHRLDSLRKVPAAIRFASFEPLLERVDADLTDIDWAIIGGESGNGARPMDEWWVEHLINASKIFFSTAIFVKQMGSDWARLNRARHPKGADPSEWPERLRVREYPAVR